MTAEGQCAGEAYVSRGARWEAILTLTLHEPKHAHLEVRQDLGLVEQLLILRDIELVCILAAEGAGVLDVLVRVRVRCEGVCEGEGEGECSLRVCRLTRPWPQLTDVTDSLTSYVRLALTLTHP